MAERRQVFDLRAVERALERTRGRHGPGHERMRAALAEHAALGTQLTRSALEERFAALLDAHGLPRPRLNARVTSWEVDAWWPAERLAVELDGFAFHRGRVAMQRDRSKDRALTLAGVRVLRFTHDDVVRAGPRVAREVAAALATSAGRVAAAGG